MISKLHFLILIICSSCFLISSCKTSEYQKIKPTKNDEMVYLELTEVLKNKQMILPTKFRISTFGVNNALGSLKSETSPGSEYQDPIWKLLQMDEWGFVLTYKVVIPIAGEFIFPEGTLLKRDEYGILETHNISPVIYSPDKRHAAVIHKRSFNRKGISFITEDAPRLYLFLLQGNEWIYVNSSQGWYN